MHGHKYNVGDRVYRTVSSPFIPKGTKGTVGHCRMSHGIQVNFDNGSIWYCSDKFIKPLVRVVG
ncbi:hypothetical protein CPT_Paty_017 [Acinetobacter phage Paty]|uniref:Uncharacterized protein n=2 Tax=Friunavirus TaxID=1985711 RepID=A0A7T8EU56_9CAUD|nr:hypothetical protein CPT_Paty_017 [Acinetobacter phage Paty]QQO92939.1 hypothetical protein CPT_Pipo_018 [Acinetobacter phage Pipo]